MLKQPGIDEEKMTEDIYDKLAISLDNLPNGFPRTQSCIEIQILKMIFSPEDASIASHLSGSMEPVDKIAKRIGISTKETKTKLMEMVEKGLIWYDNQSKIPKFRLKPFVVGLFETHMRRSHHKFAHLIEEYFSQGGAEGIMKPQPALHRVIPSQSAVKSEWILPYDDVKSIFQVAKAFNLHDCVCRVQQDYVGRRCDFPLQTCLSFSSRERQPRPGDISKEKALEILDEFEELGLVHTVSNVIEGLSYVCNCCGCCCAILRAINDWGIENSVAYANYYSVINTDECTGCGICIDRCQVKAISEKEGVAFVNQEQCIGCGLCVTGCPTNAAKLHSKPEDQIIKPPVNFETWEKNRIYNRSK